MSILSDINNVMNMKYWYLSHSLNEHAEPSAASYWACADPEGGGAGSADPHLENHKNIGFLRNIDPDPLKSQSHRVSIQCWAIIGMPAKRH